LYWYRSAPGVRVGRPALDEDAIRTIEEQHPEIEFDWPHILEVSAAAGVEVERRPERGPLRGRAAEADRQRRKPTRPREEATPTEPAAELAQPTIEADEPLDADAIEAKAFDEPAEPPSDVPPRAHDILEELVGRDIATRLRARYAEINARIHGLSADEATRAAWQARAEPLNPDSWITPDEILSGVSRADELFDALRRALLA
jgi:hypothetical protein